MLSRLVHCKIRSSHSSSRIALHRFHPVEWNDALSSISCSWKSPSQIGVLAVVILTRHTLPEVEDDELVEFAGVATAVRHDFAKMFPRFAQSL